MYKKSIYIWDGPALTALKTVLGTELNESVVHLSEIEIFTWKLGLLLIEVSILSDILYYNSYLALYAVC